MMTPTGKAILFFGALFFFAIFLDLSNPVPPIWLRSKETGRTSHLATAQPATSEDEHHLETSPSFESSQPPEQQAHQDAHHDVTIIVASQTKDDTKWISDGFAHWDKRIYVTNDPHATYRVPANHGREGMVYLTYIIDNYHNLSNVNIFSHANRYQWHNDDPLYDGERMLQRLQINHIRKQGYISLRCVWVLGCPVEIRPIESENETPDGNAEDATTGSFYKAAFEEMFPGEEVPAEVGATCCAQFAATREKILERPKSDYERYRKWLLETKLKDDLSGRIMEYSWHIIFGQKAIFCPNTPECYCKTYGLCHLECENEGNCDSQYALPQYSTTPDGWPDYGFDGKWRNITLLRLKQGMDYTPEDAD